MTLRALTLTCLACAFGCAHAWSQTAPTAPARPASVTPLNPSAPKTFTPTPGDDVVVGFQSGQPATPVITGPLQSGKDTPPASATGGAQTKQPVPLRTRSLPAEQSVQSSPKSVHKKSHAPGHPNTVSAP
jgi:hypothetical protein